MHITRTWRLGLAAAAIVWVAAVAVGFAQLWEFAYTPGPAASAPARWPSPSLPHDPTAPTLVMVLHPECSCSEASLEELSRLLARTRVRVRTLVLFNVPSRSYTLSPVNSLWRAATAMPGVAAIVDRGGAEAERFGALVSGQTFLYDARGDLQFSGGITSARGHAGDNDGEAALWSLLAADRAAPRTTSVFGCALPKADQS